MSVLARSIDRAVRAICPDIAIRIERAAPRAWSEIDLWWELTRCLLSSQVRYEHALAATERLKERGLIPNAKRMDAARFRRAVGSALASALDIDGRRVRYRFPKMKAAQLARTRDALQRSVIGLKGVVYGSGDQRDKRQNLVDLVTGFGPKQASMFLRNCGAGYGLAVLDRHTLRFMRILGLIGIDGTSAPLSMRRYEFVEDAFTAYADRLGYPVGYVDWAVWIVMKTLSGSRTEEHTAF